MSLESRVIFCSVLLILSMGLSEHTSSWFGSKVSDSTCPAQSCVQGNVTGSPRQYSELRGPSSFLHSSQATTPIYQSFQSQCSPLQSPGWESCLAIKLPLGTGYINDSKNPKSHYCHASTGHQKAAESDSPSGQFFVGMPEADESDQDDNPTTFCQSSAHSTVPAPEPTCHTDVYIPRLYAAADTLLQQMSASEPPPCCCMLVLDQYIIWADMGFRGLKGGRNAFAGFQYSPLDVKEGPKIGLMSWISDTASYSPVYKEVDADYVRIGLRAYMNAAKIPLDHLKSLTQRKLDTVSEINIGFTFVVALNQYCFKGVTNTTCPIRPAECLHDTQPMNLVKTLAANQVFSWQTFNINSSGCIISDTGRTIKFNNTLELACLERFASDHDRIDIVNSNLNSQQPQGIIDYCRNNYSSVRPESISPKWWNHQVCLNAK